MDPVMIANADRWIEDHYVFFHYPQLKGAPTLEWLLDRAEVAIVRHGAKVIQIDPWNRLEEQRGRDEMKTDYVGRCLRTLYGFAQSFNVHVQILAHPAKMDSARKGQAPYLEDISDSKNWDNMVDAGYVVHRPKVFDKDTKRRVTEAQFICRKSRYEELGYPCVLDVNYELAKGKYVSLDCPPEYR
jgi:twinkle protein